MGFKEDIVAHMVECVGRGEVEEAIGGAIGRLCIYIECIERRLAAVENWRNRVINGDEAG